MFSEKWQTLGFDTLTEDFTNGTPGFWLSFTLAGIWLFFAFFSYFIYDIQQNTGALMTNRRFKTAMSLLPNSLFFFITLNLLQALRFPDSPSSPLYYAPETAQVWLQSPSISSRHAPPRPSPLTPNPSPSFEYLLFH